MKRSFLKWVGGKYRLLPELLKEFPEGDVFVDLFAGSGVVSLNVDYPHYVLNDINAKLITTFNVIKNHPRALSIALRFAFSKPSEEHYLRMRETFNSDNEVDLTYAVGFIYLNRYGFNGLSRFNSKGEFNAPYGHLKSTPKCPIDEIETFSEFLNKDVAVLNYDFTEVLELVKTAYNGKRIVVYADPPYIPLSDTASFRGYHNSPFGEQTHRVLAEALINFSKQTGATIILSNSDTELTREIYHEFELKEVSVQRLIAAKKSSRGEIKEIVAIYK